MRAATAIIHLANVRHNAAVLRRLSGGRRVCAAVKANGYGHGAVEVARCLRAEGVEALGVATVEEGVELRRAEIGGAVLVYSLPHPSEYAEIVRYGLEPFVCHRAMCAELARVAGRAGATVGVHLKVDTGMGRIGCRPSEVGALVRSIRAERALRLVGVATHLADSMDCGASTKQHRRWAAALDAVRDGAVLVHSANSGAVINGAIDLWDMVRPGIALYGYHPTPDSAPPLGVKPVMEVRSRIVYLKAITRGQAVSYGATWRSARDTVIATIPLGYGDGIPRALSNRGYVEVHREGVGGRLAPVVGAVCMDQCMIDVGHIPNVRLYDEVTFFGPPPATLDAAVVARQCGTIAYEILTSISPRVPRVYQ